MLLKSRSYSSLITKSWSSNLESPPTRGRELKYGRFAVADHRFRSPPAGASRNSVDGKEERGSVLPPSHKKFSPEDLC